MGKDLKGKELGRGLSQRPDGRYMGRAQVEGKPIVLYGWKVKELKKELVRAVDDLKRSNLLPEEDGTGITLSEWFEEWYSKYKAPTLKDGGSPAYKRKFLNYYGVRIGSKYLADIRQLHVQTAIADMVESGRSSKSIREATGILQNCIEAAIANGLMRINPVVGTIVPKCEKVERRVLTVEEQRIFLDYLAQNKSWYEELYKFMLLTGLRIGEVGGLQWEDIDFKKKVIHVKHTLCYFSKNGKYVFEMHDTKTNNGKRTIPLTAKAINSLKCQKLQKQEIILKGKTAKEEFQNLVFVTKNNQPTQQFLINQCMQLVIQNMNKAGIDFSPFTLHTLRHTFATRAIECGMNPKTLQKLLGHGTLQMTMDLYCHVTEDTLFLEMEKFEKRCS